MVRRTILSVGVVAVLVGACGSDGDAGSSSDPVADVLDDSDVGAADDGESENDRCDLLSVAEVEAALGFTVESFGPTRFQPGCEFEFADENLDLQIEITDAPFAYDNVAGQSSARIVTGLGIRAMSTGQSRRLVVDLGDGLTLVLGVDGAITPLKDAREPLTELATLAIDRV